jgi:hypothetical protein
MTKTTGDAETVESAYGEDSGMFEYTVTYVPVRYQEGGRGSIFRGPALVTEPEPASLSQDANFERLYCQMGQDGWELVSVQPLLRGQYATGGGFPYGLGYAITAGYYFFWKRSA